MAFKLEWIGKLYKVGDSWVVTIPADYIKHLMNTAKKYNFSVEIKTKGDQHENIRNKPKQ